MPFLSTTDYEAGDSLEKILAKILVNQFGLIDTDGNLKVSGAFSASVTTNPTPTDTASIAESTLATTSGSVTTGALWATFVFSPNFSGTIAGQSFSGASGASVTFPPMGKKYPAINYTITAGSLTILTAA